ncbi:MULTISPECIES: PP2C family serine/threonine-protein phosphatase [Brevibacterium]|uniref:Protein phosphatase n=2 Tax=Brevibacterium antiquum TaxID=234835 RepID=A0A2H1I8H7_9MICO|nr:MULTISPECIES: PP2C family serine/threonine-protein phosphatase [Brevibacterium]SMX71453.1 protein phosphatase [Brevibacterium antiquum CNRZ 918]SMX81145.1 protein phosphatase [Brevibacterium antiquum]HCG54616.1 serine/threonine-protein phosphatase [Brevibacterium sp.]
MTSDGTITLRSAARSHTGLVRKNNQDSGYAGPNFLLIADGMGGHAGGDVASAITVARLADLDREPSGEDALEILRTSILEANDRICRGVAEQPELAGMGTTVTALLRAPGNRFALAHIGDSRGYVLRDGELQTVTHDHTFVQMLVDEGRITPDEAETHPQRSVVMKVLGDVGASPDLDLTLREAHVGDRWMLCSDGLTGFADVDDIARILAEVSDPEECCAQLVDLALAGGGADNVTVVIGDVLEGTVDTVQGRSVGSVHLNPKYATIGKNTDADEATTQTQPHYGNGDTDTVPMQSVSDSDRQEPTAEVVPTAQRTTTETSDRDEPTEEDDLDADDDEVEKRSYLGWIIAAIVIVAIAVGGFFAYNYMNNHYYLTNLDGKVTLYRGLDTTLGPIELSQLEDTTDIEVGTLNSFSQDRLRSSIQADSRDEADRIIKNLRQEADRSGTVSGNVEDSTSPSDPAPSPPSSQAADPSDAITEESQ